MKRKVSAVIAAVMAVGAVCFAAYAIGHPEASFPWSNGITLAAAVIYIAAMTGMFAAAFR